MPQKVRSAWFISGIIIVAAIGVIFAFVFSRSSSTYQQSNGSGGPGGPGVGAPPGGGMGIWRSVTAVNIPVSLLDTTLKLSPDQKSKIADAQKQISDYRAQIMPMRPMERGGSSSRQDMRAVFEKMHAKEQDANSQILACLSASQKTELDAMVKQDSALRMVGIPIEATPSLKLTSDQLQKISAIADKTQKTMQDMMSSQGNGSGRDQFRTVIDTARSDAMKLLTGSQQAIVKQYQNNQPGFGFPGGPGGPGGMRPGGGPGMPPPGGPGGPGGMGAPPNGGPGGPAGGPPAGTPM